MITTKKVLVISPSATRFHHYIWQVVDEHIKRHGVCDFERRVHGSSRVHDTEYIYIRELRQMRGLMVNKVIFLQGCEELKDFSHIKDYAKILALETRGAHG